MNNELDFNNRDFTIVDEFYHEYLQEQENKTYYSVMRE